MPIKGILPINLDEVNEKFKKLSEMTVKYKETMEKIPGVWSKFGSENKAIEEGFKGMTAVMLAHQRILQDEASSADKQERATKKTASHWESISTSSKAFAGNLKNAFERVLKWDLIAGAGTVLGAVGGFMGFDKLAGAATRGYQSSVGLGIPYGEMKGFGLQFGGRGLNAAGFLEAISQGRGNIAGPEANALSRLLGGGWMGEENTGAVARSALDRIWQIAMHGGPGGGKLPQGLIGPYLLEGMGAGTLGLGVQDIRRMQKWSEADKNKFFENSEDRYKRLGIDEQTLKRYQEFNVKVTTAGEKIESTFIRGLVRLNEPLSKLIDKFADMLETFFGSKGFDNLVKAVSSGLDALGNWLGSDNFKKDIKAFADNIGIVANAVVDAAKFAEKWFGPGRSASDKKAARDQRWDRQGLSKLWDWAFPGAGNTGVPNKFLPDGTPIVDTLPSGYTPSTAAGSGNGVGGFNVGALRMPGSRSFQRFSSWEEGAKAQAKQLLLDYSMGQNTLRKLIMGNRDEAKGTGWYGYVGADDPNQAAYLKQMSARTGLKVDEQFDMTNPNTLAKIMSAISKNENVYPISQEQALKVIIDNKAGADVTTAAAQMGSGVQTPRNIP